MAESDDSSKANLPLEEQNREELLKHCKRQVLLLQKTKAKLDEHKKERAEVESQLKAQLEDISKQNDLLRSQISQEASTRATLENQIKDLELRNGQLEATVREVQSNSANLNDFNEATNELNLLREEKRGLVEQLDSLETIKETALQLEKQLVKSVEENKDLAEQLKEANEKSSNFEAELTSQRGEFEHQLQELKEKLMQAELQLRNLETERQEFQTNERKMQCRIEALESNEKTLTANHDNDQAHIFQLSDSLEKTSQEEILAKNELHKVRSQLKKTVSLLAKGLKVIHESPVSQIERFVYLSSDIIEELLELSPPDDVSEGLGKFREHIKPMLQGFIRTAERWRALDHQKQQLVTNLAEVTERAEALQATLDVEKEKRQESEQKHLEAAEECEILKSTTTALTNQLEQTQLKLEQMMNSPTEANSTDDDKNSSDEARTESQLLALRERITALEADIENERALRAESQRSLDTYSASLISLRQTLADKETEVARLETQLAEQSCQQAEKSQLVENLHSTIDDLVERANSNVFSHSDDGCSVACRLLRLFEQLAEDFDRQAHVEQRMLQMKPSDDALETWLRTVLRQFVSRIREAAERNAASPQLPDASDTVEPNTADKDLMLKERDEKIVKLRNLLVKMKKELAEVKTKQPLLASNMQSMQNEYDKVVDSLEAEKNTGKELQKKIAQTMNKVAEMELQLSQVNDEKRQIFAELERVQSAMQEADRVKAEAEAQVLVVQNELEKSRQEVDRLRDELSQHIQQTTTLQVDVSALQQQLEKNRDAMDEGKQLAERNKRLEDEAKQAKEAIEKLVIEKAQCEVRLNEILTRAADADELARVRERLELELEHSSNKLIDALRQVEMLEASLKSTEAQLHSKDEKLNEVRLQESERCREIHELQTLRQAQKDSQTRMIRTLEGKSNALKKDYDTVVLELQESKRQFETYKMKVHSMMKTKKETPERKVEPVDSTELQALKATIEELTQQVSSSKYDLEASHEEIARLKENHERSLKDLSAHLEQGRSALSATFAAEKEALKRDLETEHKAEVEALVARHKHELERRELSNRNLVEILEEKLVEARSKLESLEELRRSRDTSHSPVMSNTSSSIRSESNNNGNSTSNSSSNHHNNNSNNNNNNNNNNSISQYNNDGFLDTPVRQPAEGSESTGNAQSVRTLPFDVIPSSGFQPLDKLLEHQDIPSFETFESITSKLEEAMRRIDHFTELLNESEVNNLRLSEQVRVLKEEVRRLERNKEREEQFGNLEYLKNVVLKYLTMKSERERLVPVLVTMLKLSPDERRILQEGDQGWGLLPKFL